MSAGYPEAASAMVRFTRGYHETAKYLLYHNKRRKAGEEAFEAPVER